MITFGRDPEPGRDWFPGGLAIALVLSLCVAHGMRYQAVSALVVACFAVYAMREAWRRNLPRDRSLVRIVGSALTASLAVLASLAWLMGSDSAPEALMLSPFFPILAVAMAYKLGVGLARSSQLDTGPDGM